MLWRGGLAALPGFRYSSGVIADAERQLPMLAALASAPTVRTHCARADDAILKRRIATLMTTRNRKNPPVFVSRYIGVDTHLTERKGSTEQVYGIAAERPAGRKLAQDIAQHCNQLYADGYEVISLFPLLGGRTAEVSAEAAEMVQGRTYEVEDDTENGESEINYYVDTGVGYSVTEGAIITARLRQ